MPITHNKGRPPTRIQIRSEDPFGCKMMTASYHVSVNGSDLSSHVRRISVDLREDSLAVVTMEFLTDDIEIDLDDAILIRRESLSDVDQEFVEAALREPVEQWQL